MAVLKTKQLETSVPEFLEAVEGEERQKDCKVLMGMMKRVTKETPKLWGNGTVGFGVFHYKSERSRQEGDWYMAGFSPRKQNLTVYIMPGFGAYSDLMNKLGKYKTGGSCLYINKLADVDIKILEELVSVAYKDMKKKYKTK
jgi:Domain of unknown function (DU1801)